MNRLILGFINGLREITAKASQQGVPVYAMLLAVKQFEAELEKLTAEALQKESLEAQPDGEPVTEDN